MLDLLTLQKTKNWLIKRHDDIPLTGGAESIQYQNAVSSRHLLFDLIEELDQKIKAIEVEHTIRPPVNGVMVVKDTKAEKRYYCQTCHVEHSIYRIYFSTMHLQILRKVFKHCIENNVYQIHKKDIPGLTHTDYGNFYALRRFGLLYWLEEDGKKVKGGHWGVPVGLVRKFLMGNWAVAEYSEKNTASQKMENSPRRICIQDLPRYKTLTDDQNAFLPYFVKYEENPNIFTSNNP